MLFPYINGRHEFNFMAVFISGVTDKVYVGNIDKGLSWPLGGYIARPLTSPGVSLWPSRG